jgi:hypothetical protein
VAKDVVGNELYDHDIVQLDLAATRCIGVIKEVHRDRPRRIKGKPAPRSGYMRIVAHFDVPFDDAEGLLSGVVKVMNPDHHKRIYGERQAEPIPALRRLQEAAYDHRFDDDTVNTLPR